MPVSRMDHFTIRTSDMEGTRDFYVQVLGLEEGERPPFEFPGYWLYCGERPLVHLVGMDRARNRGGKPVKDSGAAKGNGPPESTGAVDHLAFALTDGPGLVARLREQEIPFKEQKVPRTGMFQIFLQDPNGVWIELNYREGD